MAPEGLGVAARSPTVLLYAAKKADRTSCSLVSRSLRAVSRQLLGSSSWKLKGREESVCRTGRS